MEFGFQYFWKVIEYLGLVGAKQFVAMKRVPKFLFPLILNIHTYLGNSNKNKNLPDQVWFLFKTKYYEYLYFSAWGTN